MSAHYSVYSVEAELKSFFEKTSVTRTDCDVKAIELVGGDVVPVAVQGACSYTVYAGPSQDFVVQFRFQSLPLDTDIMNLAAKVYGSLAPSVNYRGTIGEGDQPLRIYVMPRIPGITRLDFVLARGHPFDSDYNVACRLQRYCTVSLELVPGVSILTIPSFMALSWEAPQAVSPSYRAQLKHTYTKDLTSLHKKLPDRFKCIIETCLSSIDDILDLPIVLLHRDFGDCNVMVHEETCHLTGVIDWAEADIAPFGLNLHSLQAFSGRLHLRDGWSRYDDYEDLQDLFWSKFQEEVRVLSPERLRTIKLARVLGLLLSRGFTSRLANQAEPVPIGDDEQGRYNMMSLDGFLINPSTRFECIE